MSPTVILVGGPALSLLALAGSIAAVRKKRLVQDTPTSKVQGVFIGTVEIKGTAEAEAPLRSALAGRACVHYTWKVEERRTRTVTTTKTGPDGQSRTSTSTSTDWETVARGGETIPFFLRDDTGVIRILPDGAEIEADEVFSRTCGPSDSCYYGKGPAEEVGGSDHVRRFTEKAIPLHASLYVFGHARERKDVVAAEIARDPSVSLYVISTRSEKSVTRRFALRAWGLGVLGAALAAGTVAAWRAARDEPIQPHAAEAALAALGYVGTWAVGWIGMLFNSLVGLRQRVRQAWSVIDVELKRRHDLIANLAEATRALRDHEQRVQTEVAALRAQLGATPPGEPGPDPRGCAPLLRAVVERYPELKANEGFRRMQEGLIETEQRIALARGYFNEIASDYNGRLEKFPDLVLARLCAFRPRPLFAAADFERAPVQVKLAE